MKESVARLVESLLTQTLLNSDWFRHTGRGWWFRALIGVTVLTSGSVRLLSAPEPSPPSTFHPVDLGPWYSLRFPTGSVGGFWSRLPRGSQTLANVPFLVGGKLELTGMDAARAGTFRPSRVTGIPVSRTASRLHLLHGTAHGGKDGIPFGEMVLHYNNGDKRSFRIVYGVHARNWIRDDGEQWPALHDPSSVVAWSSPARGDDGPAGRLRFFKTTFSNPLPDREITTIDLVSFFGKATPIVFALTLEQGGTAGPEPDSARVDRQAIRDANAYGESVYVGTMRVRVTDASGGSPLTNGTVNVTLSDGGPPFLFGEYPIDSRGGAVFWYPAQHAVALHLQARSPGFAPTLASILRRGPDAFFPETVVGLDRGQSGGGVVRSTLGPPVANASILIVRDQLAKAGEFLAVAWDRAASDAEGRWTTDTLPNDLTGFRILLSHSDFDSATYTVDRPGASNRWSVSAEDLTAGTAEMSIKPRLRVSGKVMDGRGVGM